MFKNLLNINEIEFEYRKTLKKIQAPLKFYNYITFNNNDKNDGVNIEINKHGYNYILSERGIERERRATFDIKELMFWIFWDITFIIALDNYHTCADNNKYDPRRIYFKNQLKIFKTINIEYEQKARKKIIEIINRNPFKDGLPNNMDYEIWEYPEKHENKHSTQIPSIDSLITQFNTGEF
jgi:hypothetical protein